MNKQWSEQNKKMQSLLKKQSYEQGILELLELRNSLMDKMYSWKDELSCEEFSINPFCNRKINRNANHNATIAWSLWHIFRIEDIVVNTLINKTNQIIFSDEYINKLNNISITTGNEQTDEEMLAFSKALNIGELYKYISEVKQTTDNWLKSLEYQDLNKKFTDEDKINIQKTETVSTSEDSFWLIDYWCGKTVKGLIQMPLSRHWIMHVEAGLYIIETIKKQKN